MMPPAWPTATALLHITHRGNAPVMPPPMAWKAIQALLVHTWAAKSGAGLFE